MHNTFDTTVDQTKLAAEIEPGKKKRYWIPVVLILLAVAIRLPDFFLHMNRDSGMFAYGGWRILHGELPYVDFWDNKLPGVFYINALAIRLFGASQSGLVLFQMVYAAATGCLFFFVARRFCGWKGAFAVSLLFVFYSGCYGLKDDGNYTECYTALPSLLAVWMLLKWSRGRRSLWLPTAAGVLAMLAAIIKQPAAALIGAMLLYLLFGVNGKQRYAAAAALVVGSAATLIALVAWMSGTGILQEAVQANVVFNRLYFIDAYTYGMEGALWNLWRSLALVALPLAGAVGGLFPLRVKAESISKIGWLLAPWFALDLIGLAMGGRFTNHYFLTILPSAMLLTGLFLDGAGRSRASWTAIAGACLLMSVGPVWTYSGDSHRGQAYPVKSVICREWDAIRWIAQHRFVSPSLHPVELVAQYVREQTDERDQIYVWGWDTRIGFLAQRAFPSRYLHTHPLGATGFDRNRRIAELADALEAHLPKLIIDGSAALPTTAPSLAARDSPLSTSPFFRLDGYELIQSVIATRYEAVDDVKGYVIYMLRSEELSSPGS